MIMKFIFALVLSFMPGIINLFWLPGGLVSEWYSTLIKFPFTPDLYTFGFIWSVIHLMMGVALFFVMDGEEETDNKNKAVGLFLTNIILSAIWPFLLFKYHIIMLSTLDSVALITVAFLMRKSFAQENNYAGYAVWIYIMWLTFALYLNLGLLIMN